MIPISRDKAFEEVKKWEDYFETLSDFASSSSGEEDDAERYEPRKKKFIVESQERKKIIELFQMNTNSKIISAITNLPEYTVNRVKSELNSQKKRETVATGRHKVYNEEML